MVLLGQQIQELQNALIGAFLDKVSLEQMLLFGLNKNLREIAGEGNLKDIIFKLIQTANIEGWVENLVCAACDYNPGNIELRAIAKQILQNQGEIPDKKLILSIFPVTKINQELNDGDIETLRELLQLSGRAAPERRKALCIEIGISSGDLATTWILSENDFAVELIDILHKRKLDSVFCRLCKKLAIDFQGGEYNTKLVGIKTKLNCQ